MTTKILEDDTLNLISEIYGEKVAKAIEAIWPQTDEEIDLSAIAYQLKNANLGSESSS